MAGVIVAFVIGSAVREMTAYKEAGVGAAIGLPALIALFGMFWVGMPYTLRNQITWITATETRWRAAAFAGLAYGALLCAGGLLVR